ncbi:MAG: hypothetical protein IJJ29_09120 [Solobacterium sp.]|nr:hypothetical protein [Solobacterium sp.]
MTLNKYQKLQGEIHLSEERRQDILTNLASADLRPVQRKYPVKMILSLGMVILMAVLILPRSLYKGASGGAAPMLAEQAVETVSEDMYGANEAGSVPAAGAAAAEIMIMIDDVEVYTDAEYTYARFVYDGNDYMVYRTSQPAEINGRETEAKQEEDPAQWIREYLNEIKGKEHE